MGVPWRQQGRDGQLTETQQAYMDAIGRWANEDGVLPTVRELAKDLGVPPSTAMGVIGRLRGKGYLGTGRRGQMSLTPKGQQALGGSE